MHKHTHTPNTLPFTFSLSLSLSLSLSHLLCVSEESLLLGGTVATHILKENKKFSFAFFCYIVDLWLDLRCNFFFLFISLSLLPLQWRESQIAVKWLEMFGWDVEFLHILFLFSSFTFGFFLVWLSFLCVHFCLSRSLISISSIFSRLVFQYFFFVLFFFLLLFFFLHVHLRAIVCCVCM